MKTICPILTKLYTHVCDHDILIKFDSHGNHLCHLGVTALYLQKTTWKISCQGQTSTLLGALASNIHRCLSYMCRLSWIIIIALTFCGKKSEVGASVSYGHISSSALDSFVFQIPSSICLPNVKYDQHISSWNHLSLHTTCTHLYCFWHKNLLISFMVLGWRWCVRRCSLCCEDRVPASRLCCHLQKRESCGECH